MKSTKLFPVVVVILSVVMLSACSSSSMSLAAPAAAITGQTVQVSESLASAPVVTNSPLSADVAALQNAYESVYQTVNPSVVTIEISSQVYTNSRLRGFSQGNGQSGQSQIVPTAEGSGFIWDTAGHIVTNNHVVDGAAKISVTFSDGSTYDAKLVGTDATNDLAVVQVTGAPASLLKPITVGDSSQVRVGQMVVAIGNPYGLANTMTTGVVSGINRSIPSDTSSSQNPFGSSSNSASISGAIQTDAAINPGNSGGVLVDMNGSFIGVPSQIESSSDSNSGVGFAIPSATVSKIVPQLIAKGAAL